MLLGAVEACVAALVNKLASSFVQHVWKHNFSFGWWRGTIEVKDVAVQPDLLRRALGLPFVVLAGTVGALRVRIPWRALFSEPITITLERVTLKVRPDVAGATGGGGGGGGVSDAQQAR